MTRAELDKKIEKYIKLKELGLSSQIIENEIASAISINTML
jgi:hypothetical protein